jgi:hypothetical protein
MKKISVLDPTELYQATCMILSNLPTQSADVVLFHARGVDDDDGLFELVTRLIQEGRAHKIAINGFDGISTTEPGKRIGSGKDFCIKKLSPLIDPKIIIPTDPAQNTIEENRAFLKLARERNWKSGIIVAQPHQLLRAMLGAVKEISKHEMNFRLHSVCPQSVDWDKNVFANQGVQSVRFDNISAELNRIPEYIAQGDLATLEELIAFLRKN